jgi:putative nucleotidyltransferase with HDIG domain
MCAPDLPFVFLSGLYDMARALDILRVGASDYLLKPAQPNDILHVVDRCLATAAEQRVAIRTALEHYLDSRDLNGSDHGRTLRTLFNILGFRRFETFQHSQRVARFALLIGERLGLNESMLHALEIGALLHDIGKAGIPHNVVMKPGKLNAEEWRVMKTHSRLGWAMLVEFPGLELEAQIVYSHHEQYSGAGYPRGLAGDKIPIGARIFAVADTLDAITSHRCYRPARSVAEAREEIVRVTGTQLDPYIARCVDHVSDLHVEDIRARYPD